MKDPVREKLVAQYIATTRPAITSWQIAQQMPEDGLEMVMKDDGKWHKRNRPDKLLFSDKELKQLLEDDKFYRKYKAKLIRENELATKLYKLGCIDKEPWWDTYDTSSYPQGGLASLKPMSRDRHGQQYLVYGLSNKESRFDVYVNDKYIGFSPLAEPALWKRILGVGRDEYDNALLATQQLAIQRWGSFQLTGSQKYIDNALNIAVKNGTWQYITNNKLQSRIDNMVRNESGIDHIWKKLINQRPNGNIDIRQLEKATYSAITGAIFLAREHLGGEKIDKDLAKYLDALEKDCSYQQPGSFVNSLIASGRGANTGFQNNLSVVMKKLAENQELLTAVREQAARKLAMYTGAAMEGATPIVSPQVDILANALGIPNAAPTDIIKASNAISDDLDRLKDDSRVDERTRKTIQDVMATSKKMSSAETEAEARQKIIAAESSQESMSENISQIMKNMKNFGITTQLSGADYQKLASAFGDKNNERYRNNERYKINGLPDDPRDLARRFADLDGTTFSYGAMNYAWSAHQSAEGPTLLLSENDSDNQPVAMVVGNVAISQYDKNSLAPSELSYALSDAFGAENVERIMTNEQFMQASSQGFMPKTAVASQNAPQNTNNPNLTEEEKLKM